MNIIDCNFDRHAAAILDIFNDAIINSTALYEYHPRTMQTMESWFHTKVQNSHPIVGVESIDGELLGFASYGAFRAWPAYKYSVEHSVYVHPKCRGKGVGTILMKQLIRRAAESDYHMMVGGIDIDNQASIALHEKLGFVPAGIIRQAGFKFNRWLDLAFYQLIMSTPRQPVDG